jgi:hypothetical protein
MGRQHGPPCEDLKKPQAPRAFAAGRIKKSSLVLTVASSNTKKQWSRKYWALMGRLFVLLETSNSY